MSKYNYSVNYKLNEQEKELLLQILLKQDPPVYKYSATTILLLKEFDFDIRRIIRLAIADRQSRFPLFNPSFIKKLTMLIKEVIIIAGIRENLALEEPVSITALVRQPKYKRLGIDRNMLYRTVKKYNISLKK